MDVTDLLIRWRDGDAAALHALTPMVYAHLRSRAAALLARESPAHTLTPSALTHEAFLRLVRQRDVSWQSRAHFVGVAAHLMRLILVDHARQHRAQKRGPNALRVTLDDAIAEAATDGGEVSLLALDEALGELGAMDERQLRIVELRYFGGLTIEETAEALEIAPATVKREWRLARAWLHSRLGGLR